MTNSHGRLKMRFLLYVVIFSVSAVCAIAQTARPSQMFETSARQVKIPPIDHASRLIEAGVQTIYRDPAKPSDFTGLPPADLILITDIHGDHMDPAAIASVSKPGTQIIAPAAVVKTVTTAKTLSNGETTKWEQWTIEAVPMYNLVRGPEPGKLFHDKGRGNGYVLTYGGKRFYFAGDTEDIPEMRALENIDVAFVCFNLPYTITPEEAPDGVRAFHPKVGIPSHFPNSHLTFFQTQLKGPRIHMPSS